MVHRDYSNAGRDIKVGIYDDILNIVSPGGLPNGLTLSEALKGRSEIRNKVLARVFKELGYIEQWGSGMSRIRELCQQASNPEPAFSESGDFVDIEFARDTSLAATDTDETGGPMDGSMGGSISGKVAQTELTDRQLAVLELIKRDPHMPYRKMAEELGINDSAVKKHLDKLKAAGAIERVGGTRGYWKVKV
ncbi:winged helix-turn-helix transcriptional regulator [Halomonas sp. CH40]